MEIKGKVHCFFEQSGTFKNEFIKLGIPAEDYDIQNNFGETDHVIDLFAEIENAYNGGGQSVFDSITCDDLIMAFFPCVFFNATSQIQFSFNARNYKNLTMKETADKILERSAIRERFYTLAIKMCATAKIRGLRLIMENPWSEQTYLKANFVQKPSVIDNNRMNRGDYFVKPTAYFYFGCEPTFGSSLHNDKKKRRITSLPAGGQAGLCSEERSMISPDYARNFICDFILGKEQIGTQLTMFE